MQKGDSGIHANQGGVTGNKLVFYADSDLDRKATASGVAITGHVMEGNAGSGADETSVIMMSPIGHWEKVSESGVYRFVCGESNIRTNSAGFYLSGHCFFPNLAV